MTLDQRARSAGGAVRDEVAAIVVPEPRTVVRRVAHRRRISGGLAVVVLVAAAGLGWRAAADDAPAGTPLAVGAAGAPGWSRVLKADAGLGDGTSLDAVASDGESALIAGGTAGGNWWQPAVWWSDDGRVWHDADLPVEAGQEGEVFTVALHDGTAVAIGRLGGRDDPSLTDTVWRSDDDGRTWIEVARGDDTFGLPAPGMGRPFAGQLLFWDGWWVASGGSSTGYAGIWVSRTGEDWEQVLESQEGGSVSLVDHLDGRLMAYTTDSMWLTDDPASWGERLPMSLPDDRYPSSIAAGGSLAVGQSYESHLLQQALRSEDAGTQWHVEDTFEQHQPRPFLVTAANVDGTEVLAGADAQDRPAAWLSEDGGPWEALPEDLRGSAGGMLILVAEIDDQLVLLGTAPELDRFYVYRP